MGRYIGPRTRVCRRLRFLVFDNTGVEKAYLKREAVRQPRRLSEYGRRLQEKQKIMYYYGMRERQMRRFFEIARRQPGNTGKHFLALCERRLDHVVHAAGFALTHASARQLVAHGHVRVNGRKVDVSSALVNSGDAITFADNPAVKKMIQANLERRAGYEPPDWIAVDPQTQTAKIVRLPQRDDVRLPVNDQFVVEFYSR